MKILALPFFMASICFSDIGSCAAISYDSIYIVAKERRGFSCDDKTSFVVIEFFEKENRLKKHKKGDVFFLISHDGKIIAAQLNRIPSGTQDKKCETIVNVEDSADNPTKHYFGTLIPTQSINWTSDADLIMAVGDVRPPESDIGAVFKATDQIETNDHSDFTISLSGGKAEGDVKTADLAKEARKEIVVIINRDENKRHLYGRTITATAYRIVSPDRKTELLIENTSDNADGGKSFLFEIKGNKLNYISHNSTPSTIYNATNFDHGKDFEVLENIEADRLESHEALIKFPGHGIIKTFRTYVSD